MEDRKYMKYIGQYVKRFYTPFDEQNIWKLGDYREIIYFEKGKPLAPRSEFHYWQGHEEFWSDVEDSIIISNEEIISDDEKVANIDHPDYKGYNPFA